MRGQRFVKQRIDATDIHHKYKDFVLMKDIQLQELHISEIGLKDALYEDVVVSGYRNVATVFLPGTGGHSMKPLQTETNARKVQNRGFGRTILYR